ncbi:MAG: hypothetical protein FWG17_01900 [Desulfovibrionaceae bacterium]|nr:hypothetical protein [Desulfovibrionaceae bacterium]
MTKRQPSGTGKRPTRFCKFLLLAALVKLSLLGMILAEPFVPSMPAFWPFTVEKPELALFSAPVLREKPEKTAAPPPAPVVLNAAAPESSAETRPAESSPASAKAQPRSLAGLAFAASANPPSAPLAQASSQPINSLTLDAMNRRQEELNRREQELRNLETELNGRLEEMQGLEMRLQTMLRDAEETRSEKYKHLVDVFANMKARQAAEVLDSLDEKIAVKILAGMRGRQAGEILTYAPSFKAARLSEALTRMQMPLE